MNSQNCKSLESSNEKRNHEETKQATHIARDSTHSSDRRSSRSRRSPRHRASGRITYCEETITEVPHETVTITLRQLAGRIYRGESSESKLAHLFILEVSLRSIHVFSRTVNGRMFVSIGELRVPEGCYSLGTFRTLEEARRFRDKKRLEAEFGLLDGPYPHRKVRNAVAGR